jgi:hypothetical protein
MAGPFESRVAKETDAAGRRFRTDPMVGGLGVL